MAYVALSRFKTLEGIHLINFVPWIIRCSPPAFEEMRRLRRKLLPAGECLLEEKCNQLPREHLRIGVVMNRKVKARAATKAMLKEALVQANAQAEQDLSVCLKSVFVFSRQDGENTCYANASISAFLHLDPIIEALKTAGTGSWSVLDSVG